MGANALANAFPLVPIPMIPTLIVDEASRDLALSEAVTAKVELPRKYRRFMTNAPWGEVS
jgi:hypothetical protein